MHHYQDLITLFNSCFAAEYNTRLIKGDDEPIYLPADEQRLLSCLVFSPMDFLVVHCMNVLIGLLLGEERRKLVDFGYWYLPDGRTAEEQAGFLNRLR